MITFLKGKSCKLRNYKYMAALTQIPNTLTQIPNTLTQIPNTETFAFIVVLGKLLQNYK